MRRKLLINNDLDSCRGKIGVLGRANRANHAARSLSNKELRAIAAGDLYDTMSHGGAYGGGTVFKVTPQEAIAVSLQESSYRAVRVPAKVQEGSCQNIKMDLSPPSGDW